ncbi:MAG TPA: PIN domain-containing protein [Longimicrobiaceae bacterium]
MPPAVVVDTNVVFSALLKDDSPFTQMLMGSRYEFFIAEFVFVELFKHKERIVRASRLTQDEILKQLEIVLQHLTIYKGVLVPGEQKRKAFHLCADVDPKDATHVAVALALDAPLWTGDQKLRRGLEAKGFTRFFDPDRA